MTSPDASRARRLPAPLLCAALAVLLCGAGCASFWQGLAPQGPPADTESARRLRPGPWKVAREHFRLVDATRSTPARGDAPEAPERRLETTVWLPREAPGPRPLVIYSHGFLSDRLEASYLAEHLASHGYLVAAADFPLSSRRVADDPTVLDVVNQPGDVGFLIDWLLGGASGPPPPPAAALPDPERIAAVGLSLGGLTSTLVGFHPMLRDGRVRAVVSIAGPVSFFTHRLFETARVPFLMIASPDDAIVEYETNGAVLLERAPSALRLTIRGASHTGFAGVSSKVFRFWPNPDSVGCWYLERHLDLDPEDTVLQGLGGRENGVDLADVEPPACRPERGATAMRPRRQHRITTLAVRAFLDARFARSPERREAGRRYLTSVMAKELEEVELGGRLESRPTR